MNVPARAKLMRVMAFILLARVFFKRNEAIRKGEC
jgi:hypothetical protein